MLRIVSTVSFLAPGGFEKRIGGPAGGDQLAQSLGPTGVKGCGGKVGFLKLAPWNQPNGRPQRLTNSGLPKDYRHGYYDYRPKPNLQQDRPPGGNVLDANQGAVDCAGGPSNRVSLHRYLCGIGDYLGLRRYAPDSVG